MKSINQDDYRYPGAVMRACAEAVIIIIDVSKRSSAYNLADLHDNICSKFDFVIRQCRAGLLPESAAFELLYPLAALTDEFFLSIPEYRYYWSERPLQLRYFGEAAGGTKFFSRLEAHINAKQPKREVLEMYFVSLALGLQGMYGAGGAVDQRRRLKFFEDLGDKLRSMRGNGREEAVPVAFDEREIVAPKIMLFLVYLGPTFLAAMAAAVVYLLSRARLLNFLDRF